MSVGGDSTLVQFYQEENKTWNDMRKVGKLCDFSIKCIEDDTIYQVHKLIISSRSKYFAKLFELNELSEATKNLLEVPQINSKELEEILTYVYIKETPWSTYEQYKEILVHARYFEIPDLVKFCFKQLIPHFLKISSVLDLWRFAVKESILLLENKALLFISNNLKEIIKTPYAMNIELDEFQTILTKNLQSSISEEEIFNLLVKWCTNKYPKDKEGRNMALSKLLPLLDFGKMREDFLTKEIQTYKDLKDDNGILLPLVRELIKTELTAKYIDITHRRKNKISYCDYFLIESKMFRHFESDGNTLHPQKALQESPFNNMYYCSGTKIKAEIWIGFATHSNSSEIIPKLYSPKTCTWKDLGNRITAYPGFRTTSLNENLYLCNGDTYLNVYTGTNILQQQISLSYSHTYCGFASVNQNIFMIGGTNTEYIEMYDCRSGYLSELSAYSSAYTQYKSIALDQTIYCFCDDGYYTFDVRNNEFSHFIQHKWGKIDSYNVCTLGNQIYYAYRKDSFINICNFSQINNDPSTLYSISSANTDGIFMLEMMDT